MFTDNEYFSDETGGEVQYEQATQDETQGQDQSQPNYEQLSQGFQALQAQLQALQANPLQSLGYQPIQQNQDRFNPQDPAVQQAKEFLQAQGVMDKNSLVEYLAAETREEVALNAGYENSHHLETAFNSLLYDAKTPQAKAELASIAQLYNSGSRAGIAKAVKAFTDYKQRSQNQIVGNQTFGHVPQSQNTQNNSQVPKFRSVNEFNGWLRTQDPAKQRAIYADWQSGKISDPF